VTAISESLGEAATYCGDRAVEKLNEHYCSMDPDDGPQPMVTDARPIESQVRLVFNELLFADDAETLLDCVDVDHDGTCNSVGEPNGDVRDGVMHGSLVATQPVSISCGGQIIEYDGFYQPAGSHLTQTPGPSIVVQALNPSGFAATGSACEVTIRPDIRGKDLETVTTPAAPFTFQIASMDVLDTTPEPAADGDPAPEIAVDGEIEIVFNALVAGNSLSNITVVDGNGTPHPIIALDFDDVVEVRSANGAFDPGTSYTLTINAGVADIRGGQYAGGFSLNFTTAP
jgi:hypothetical protein